MAGVSYSAFVDPSGGSADSMTLAIGHRQDDVAVLDAVRERRPPFSPEDVVADFAALLKSMKLSKPPTYKQYDKLRRLASAIENVAAQHRRATRPPYRCSGCYARGSTSSSVI